MASLFSTRSPSFLTCFRTRVAIHSRAEKTSLSKVHLFGFAPTPLTGSVYSQHVVTGEGQVSHLLEVQEEILEHALVQAANNDRD